MAEEQTDPDAGNGVDRGEDQQVGQVPRDHVRQKRPDHGAEQHERTGACECIIRLRVRGGRACRAA